MKKLYHYTESGLSNVWLDGIEITIDDDGDECISIPHINKLHRAIAETIVKKHGSMSGEEMAFLRSYMEETQEQFARRLGYKRLQVSRWEKGDKIPQAIDMLVRAIVNQKKLNENLPFDSTAEWIRGNAADKVVIDYNNSDYRPAVMYG